MNVRGIFLVVVTFGCVNAWAVYSDNDLRMLRSERVLLDDRKFPLQETPGQKPETAMKEETGLKSGGRVPASTAPDSESPAKNPALDGKDFRLRIWDR